MDARTDGSPAGLGRRTLLRGTLAAGLAGTLGAGLTGCGGDQPSARREPGSGAGSSPGAGSTTSPSPAPAPAPRVFGPAGGPGVLLLHAWWGVSAGVLDWARVLSRAGARVVVPDLYDGQVATTEQQAESMADALDDSTVATTLDAAAGLFTGRWSVVGWSLGAFHASQMMSRAGSAPHRAVLFYGGAPLSGPTTTAQVQLHTVPDDQYFTRAEITATVASFRQAGVDVETHTYRGLGHWFAEPGSPAFDPAGTARAREAALPFLGLRAG